MITCPRLHTWHRDSFLIIHEYEIVFDRVSSASGGGGESVIFIDDYMYPSSWVTLRFRLKDADIFFHPKASFGFVHASLGGEGHINAPCRLHSAISGHDVVGVLLFTPVFEGGHLTISDAGQVDECAIIGVEGFLWSTSKDVDNDNRQSEKDDGDNHHQGKENDDECDYLRRGSLKVKSIVLAKTEASQMALFLQQNWLYALRVDEGFRSVHERYIFCDSDPI